ncbi:MAG: flagellar export chaperone FliS [Phycisphaerales bacterium]|nr:flagellar export chaperone FliS [Phycisphaerales bacterium]
MSMNQNNAGFYGRKDGQASAPIPVTNAGSSSSGSDEPNAYLQTKVLTASPAELRLMLIDGTIRFAEQARAGLISRDHEKTFEGFTKSRAIVTELISGLNPEADPALCDRLNGLYTYIFTRLVDASSERSTEILDEVIQIIRFERETWALLVKSLSRENASAAGMSSIPEGATPPNPTTAGAMPQPPSAGRISATG